MTFTFTYPEYKSPTLIEQSQYKQYWGDGTSNYSLKCVSNNAYAMWGNATPTASSLGTAFGERANHRVQTSSFEKASDKPAEILTIYYDTRDGLFNRGVNLNKITEVASPFPNEKLDGYCTPPEGWNG